jgi:hypothetical protein
MTTKIREPARIPFHDLIQPEVVGVLAFLALLTVAILPHLLVVPALAGIGWYGTRRMLARRNDIAFLVEYFGLRRELEEIETTRRRIDGSIQALTGEGLGGTVKGLPAQLLELEEKACTVAMALRKLEEGRQLADVDLELSELDRRLEGSHGKEERDHLGNARGHLIRERNAVLAMDGLQRRLEAQLIGIQKFFQAADAEIRNLAARSAAGHPGQNLALAEETRELLQSIKDVDSVMAQLDAGSIECRIEAAAVDPVDPVGRQPVALDLPGIVRAAIDRLGIGERQGVHDKLLELINELESGDPTVQHLRRRLLEGLGRIASPAEEPADTRWLFVRMIGAAIEDGHVEPEENLVLVRLASILGLSRKECESRGRAARRERSQTSGS